MYYGPVDYLNARFQDTYGGGGGGGGGFDNGDGYWGDSYYGNLINSGGGGAAANPSLVRQSGNTIAEDGSVYQEPPSPPPPPPYYYDNLMESGGGGAVANDLQVRQAGNFSGDYMPKPLWPEVSKNVILPNGTIYKLSRDLAHPDFPLLSPEWVFSGVMNEGGGGAAANTTALNQAGYTVEGYEGYRPFTYESRGLPKISQLKNLNQHRPMTYFDASLFENLPTSYSNNAFDVGNVDDVFGNPLDIARWRLGPGYWGPTNNYLVHPPDIGWYQYQRQIHHNNLVNLMSGLFGGPDGDRIRGNQNNFVPYP